MTREEAKEILSRPFNMKNVPQDILEAHRIAIKALEHPEQNVVAVVPCGDAISRQAAIEAIINMCKHYTPTKSVNHPHMDFVIEELQNLPSVNPQEPKTDWIPVSERLPEEYGEYMITWICDQQTKPLIAIAEYDITDDFDRENYRFLGEWIYDEYMSAYTNIKVIAWMPLPEPYKEESEGK